MPGGFESLPEWFGRLPRREPNLLWQCVRFISFVEFALQLARDHKGDARRGIVRAFGVIFVAVGFPVEPILWDGGP